MPKLISNQRNNILNHTILLYTFRLAKKETDESMGDIKGWWEAGTQESSPRWWSGDRHGTERAPGRFQACSVFTHLLTQQFCSWACVLNKCPVRFIRGHVQGPSLFVVAGSWGDLSVCHWERRVDGCRAGVPHGVSSESHNLGVHAGAWRHLKKQSAEWKRKRNRKDI